MRKRLAWVWGIHEENKWLPNLLLGSGVGAWGTYVMGPSSLPPSVTPSLPSFFLALVSLSFIVFIYEVNLF